MEKPKMILFDYGQTLVSEARFDGIKGTKAVLERCVTNPNNVSAEEVQQFADEMNRDIGRYGSETNHTYATEIHNHAFQNYLYAYFGMSRRVSHLELETAFWDAASPGRPTLHMEEFLLYIKKGGIRSAVISNISFSGEALKNRIDALLPQNDFEFILATSEYVFRKPHRRIFELAVKKACLEPKEIWYCGDNGICDVDGAKAAGLFPVWYKGAYESHRFTPRDESLIVSDWRELIEILEE